MTDTATMLDSHQAPSGDSLSEISRAANVAASWEVVARPTNAGSFQSRVLAARRAILSLELDLFPLPHAPADAMDSRMIALLDLRANPRLLRSGITAVSGKSKDMAERKRRGFRSEEHTSE